MDLGLKGKIALITAGSSGLGLASAKALAGEGAHVILFSRSRERLEAAVESIKSVAPESRVGYYQGDLTSPRDIDLLFERIESEWGGIDILVYSTGGPRPGRFMDLTDEDWDEAYRLLALSAIKVSRLASQIMKERGWGRIIFIGSITLERPWIDLALSSVMRMPIAGLTKTLALELAPYGITVNAVLPSVILTDRIRQIAEARAMSMGTTVEEEIRRMASRIPMGRLGRPEELGSVVAFLASERASFITGALIPVAGGAQL